MALRYQLHQHSDKLPREWVHCSGSRSSQVKKWKHKLAQLLGLFGLAILRLDATQSLHFSRGMT